MTLTLTERAGALDRTLLEMGSVVVAFSGGVDSAYLAVRAADLLGPRALAVTAVSPSLARAQRVMAERIASEFSLAHRFLETGELEDPRYTRNDADRCYRCKTELFRHLVPLASREGHAWVAYGLIVDDLSDVRPGHRAAREAGVRGPLAEAGLGKADVRTLSRERGLPTWDAPASPCLSSRVPYGTAVTALTLRRVEAAEEAVRGLGFREFRVRHLGDGARVEVGSAELPRAVVPALRAAIEAAVRSAGYRTATLDTEPYRRGRLNEALPPRRPLRVIP